MPQYYVDTFTLPELESFSISDLDIFRLTILDIDAGIYDNFPAISGTSPVLVTQTTTEKPQGYNVPGCYIAEYGGENDAYRKDITVKPTDAISTTQRYSFRFTEI